MSSDSHRMEKVVLYGAIILVVLFTILVLILALARPIQAAQPRLDALSSVLKNAPF